MDDRRDDEGPLHSEQLNRDKWRGDGGTFLDEEEARGHTLPESERDRSKQSSGNTGGVSAPIMPPD